MKHFFPPWPDDPALYPAAAIERHTAMCRELNLQDNTPPADVQAIMKDLGLSEASKIHLKANEAERRLVQMLEWSPPEYDPTDTSDPYAAITGPIYYENFAYWGGRSGGKSYGVIEAVIKAASLVKETVVVAREFLNSIDQSSHAQFKALIRSSRWASQWKITDTYMENTVTGSTIKFVGLSRNIESFKSNFGCTIMVVEEADSVSQTSVDLVLPTIRALGSRFIFIWNPSEEKTPVNKLFRSGELPERTYIRCVQGEDNKWFYRTRAPSERRTAFNKMPVAKFRWIWRGGYDLNPEGRVFNNASEGRVALPPGAVPLYGIDWGWTDPLAIVEFFIIEPDDPETERGIIYVRNMIYGSKIPSKDIPRLIRETMPMAQHHTMIADSSEPKSIDALNAAGLHVIPAKKSPGSIRAGISFFQGYDIVVSPEARPLLTEAELYLWKKLKDGTILKDPEDKNNHGWDAMRYGAEGYVADTSDDGGVVWV